MSVLQTRVLGSGRQDESPLRRSSDRICRDSATSEAIASLVFRVFKDGMDSAHRAAGKRGIYGTALHIMGMAAMCFLFSAGIARVASGHEHGISLFSLASLTRLDATPLTRVELLGTRPAELHFLESLLTRKLAIRFFPTTPLTSGLVPNRLPARHWWTGIPCRGGSLDRAVTILCCKRHDTISTSNRSVFLELRGC